MFEKKINQIWFEKFKIYLDNIGINSNMFNLDNIVEFFKGVCKSSVKSYLHIMNQGNIDVSSDWIDVYGEKIGNEIFNTMKIGGKDTWDKNPRIVKICFHGIRSCINFSRNLIIERYGLTKVWKVDRGLCLHGLRIDNFITKSNFKIGDLTIKFPGQVFNLQCDCILTTMDNTSLSHLE